MSACECGAETSCYNCLRNYRNQLWHDRISRGAAQAVLENVLAGRSTAAGALDDTLGRDLDLLDGDARPLVRAAIEAGAPPPEVGWEPDSPGGWVIEAAWPDRRVAVLTDDDPKLAAWLAGNGWSARPARNWAVPDLLDALGVSH